MNQTNPTIRAEFSFSEQRPASIPILPPLKLGFSAFGDTSRHRDPGPDDYQPFAQDGLRKRNGRMVFNHVMTTGVWWVLAGDRPCVAISGIPGLSSYAQPALIAGTGVGGRMRVGIRAHERTMWLDRFESIEAYLEPGQVRWQCADASMGISAELLLTPFPEQLGFAATLRLDGDYPPEAEVLWAFGGVGESPEFYWTFDAENPVRAFEKLSGLEDQISLERDVAVLRNARYPHTEVYVGLSDANYRLEERKADFLEMDERRNTKDTRACVLLYAPLHCGTSRFVCGWGYSGYDQPAVEEAYQRLEYRPFADADWLRDMKPRWFEHWIGRGLKGRISFEQARANPHAAIYEAENYWTTRRKRFRVETPDDRLNVAANRAAALLGMQYEYPGIAHGVMFSKYGKINCGYYGFDASGYHEEVESSLKFISGAQCLKGRQRYFTPAFAISPWAEEVNFYYVEQVWYHFRWTGDLAFLKLMWPSVRRALEHALSASDPDGDGVMTGYYEMWNCDTTARGGKCALHTAMAWVALDAACEMAKRLDDLEMSAKGLSGSVQGPFPRGVLARYEALRDKVRSAFEAQFWREEIGAWGSAEWNGDIRPAPASHEQNYHIWRGLGEPMRQYTAMRYIRETLHQSLPSSHCVEYIDHAWPVLWSHHYAAPSDACASVHSACAAGDIDHFWPLFRSVTATMFTGHDATLYQHTGSHAQEIEPAFVHTVVDGIFGVKPFIHESRFVIRPAFPAEWDHARIELAELSYGWRMESDAVVVEIETPVAREIVLEWPLTRNVTGVQVDGGDCPFEMETGINAYRIRVAIPASERSNVRIALAGRAPTILGQNQIVAGHIARFEARGCAVMKIHDPQHGLLRSCVREMRDGSHPIELVAREEGRFTVFHELSLPSGTWLHPLDLNAKRAWRLVTEYRSTDGHSPPCVASPSIIASGGGLALALQIESFINSPMPVPVEIRALGRVWQMKVHLLENALLPLSFPISNDVVPGSHAVTVRIGEDEQTAYAVCWTGAEFDASARLGLLDLSPWYTTNLRTLYSPDFQWRIDYTGCGVGVDWREPPPVRDERGYVLMSPPISQFEYGILPEQWQCTGRWNVPSLPEIFETPTGIPFRTAGAEQEKNVLALSNTEPRGALPSGVTLRFDAPARLEKIYLLTANLTKTVKCYYPGAEIRVRYADGGAETFQMIPPYTMSCVAQDFCPTALSIPFGEIRDGCDPLEFGSHPKQAYVALSDCPVDPAREVEAIEIRCVSTETLVGILGMTLLKARDS